eukprot:NODE_726_length_4776_cov_0.427106.p4 type:complete len:125 gc:universal NODE_726_length_4776_cov_0.427106:2978-2604(-)
MFYKYMFVVLPRLNSLENCPPLSPALFYVALLFLASFFLQRFLFLPFCMLSYPRNKIDLNNLNILFFIKTLTMHVSNLLVAVHQYPHPLVIFQRLWFAAILAIRLVIEQFLPLRMPGHIILLLC